MRTSGSSSISKAVPTGSWARLQRLGWRVFVDVP
jgi:hypothetical protein